MKRRLFIAATLDDDARGACAAAAGRLRATGWNARWIPPENYHLTIAFLGAVDADRLDDIVRAVRDVTGDLAPFTVRLDAVGAFPNERTPRVAWVGPARPVAAFGTLCGVVRSSLASRGLTFDARADAHVTLARADGTTVLPRIAPPRHVAVVVDAAVLYESFTEPGGARYVVLDRFGIGT